MRGRALLLGALVWALIVSPAPIVRVSYAPTEIQSQSVPEDGGGLHEVQARILKNVAEVPGMSIRDLAGILGVSGQLAMYHVRALVADGRLRLERHGVALRVYLAAEGDAERWRRGDEA